MEILYVSRLTSEKLLNEIYNGSGKNPGFAIQKFSRLLTKGLANNGCKVYSLSSPPYNRKTTSKRIIRIKGEEENGLSFSYIPILNIPILKSIVDFVYVFYFILKWSKDRKKEKAILFDVLNVSECMAGLLACRLCGVCCVGIVTDMPGLLYGRKNSLFGRIASALNNSYLGSFEKYVFITEQMNKDINKKKRPYIIMEGLVDSTMASMENTIENKNFPREILYAGGIYERFGMRTLLEAVKSLGVKNIKLVVYGDGPMANAIKKESNEMIEYRGVASNAEVVKAETKATLLVNPRPTHESFTHYSFPSKNMEYMISGTPVLTTRLPGMPTEYHSYVYIFDEESISGYANKIAEVMALSDEALHQKGITAKQFVLENKNETSQGKRVLQLLRQ